MPDPPGPGPTGDAGPAGTSAPDPADAQLLRLHAALDTTAAKLRAAEEDARTLTALHDEVVQRLFAIGMGLQSVADLEPDAALGGRMRGYLADLDETIDQLRSRVLGARPATPDPLTARGRKDAR